MGIAFRHNSTFGGDPVRAILTANQNEVIEEDQLTNLAVETGAYLTEKLKELSDRFPEFVQDVRGKGTYLAFDCGSAEIRNDLLTRLKAEGIN